MGETLARYAANHPSCNSCFTGSFNPWESLTRNMSEIEMLNMELSKHSKLDGLKIMRIPKESFNRISEVYRFLMDKINVEESKESFQIQRSVTCLG